MANDRPMYYSTIYSDMREFYSHLKEANFKLIAYDLRYINLLCVIDLKLASFK